MINYAKFFIYTSNIVILISLTFCERQFLLDI